MSNKFELGSWPLDEELDAQAVGDASSIREYLAKSATELSN
jgi:hypothetical protein